MTITQMPADVKRYWVDEAKKHGSSINKEMLRVLEEERERCEGITFLAKGMDTIVTAARHLQSVTVVDQQGIGKVLYDAQGMPRSELSIELLGASP